MSDHLRKIRARIEYAWAERRWQMLAFFAAIVVVAVFAIRAFDDATDLPKHAPRPLEPWMTMRMVAHMYDLPPKEVAEAAGLPLPERGMASKRSLQDTADETGLPVEQVMGRVEAAIESLTDERRDD